MKKYLFMERALKLISDGDFFKKIFAIILKVLAVMIGAVTIITFFSGWEVLRYVSGAGVLGVVIFKLILLVIGYMLIHTIWIRSNSIKEIPSSDVTVIPIVSLFLKLMGEVYAIFIASMSVGACILLWFVGSMQGFPSRAIYSLIPFGGLFLSGGATFISGLTTLVMGCIIAFISLVFFYLLSEMIVIFYNIAYNTKVIREKMDQK